MTLGKHAILASIATAVLLAASHRAGAADPTRSIVRIETDHGDITLELYGDEAPITVKNFLGYARRGFYDGLIFHRVIDDFMIQTGAYDPNLYDYLAGNPDPEGTDWLTDPLFYHEPNDPIVNEAKTTLKNTRGTIAMARQSAANSATSQFFINQATNTHLDKATGSAGYAVFGTVLEGMDVVDAIAAVPTSEVTDSFEALPDTPVIIERVIEILTFDDDSNDFTDVDFLAAKAPLTRSIEGQGQYDSKSYTDKFTARTIFKIAAVTWTRTGLAAQGIDGFEIILARTHDGELRVFKLVTTVGSSSHTVFEAQSLGAALPLGELLGERDLYWRLLTGRTDLANLDDPNNTLVLDADGRVRTQRIVAAGIDLAALPYYPDLVLVRDETAADPNDPESQADLRWSYYHDSAGLVLDIWHANEAPGDPNYIDPTDPNAAVLDHDGWRLAWFGRTRPVFGTYSSDFSKVDYLAAKSGTLRVYRGQGDFDGMRYLMTCSSEELLDIPCLLIEETAVAEVSRPGARQWLARDSLGVAWLFKREIGGEVLFEAARVGDILPLAIVEDPYLRLVAGAFTEPGDTLTVDDETARIEADDASLERWPDFEEELLHIKTWQGDPPQQVSHSFYHEDHGLIVDLWPEGDPNTAQLDPNGAGWAVTDAAELTDLRVNIRADRDRFTHRDSFVLRGKSTLQANDWGPGRLFFNVGSWQLVAETSDSRWTRMGNRPVYRYLDRDDDQLVMLILDLRNGNFRAVGRNVDLTGTTGPVGVELALGGYYGGGEVESNRPGQVPAVLLRGFQDALACNWFRFAYDNGPNSYNSYTLYVRGDLATLTWPLDLEEMKITIKWGSSKTWTIDKGEMQRVGNREKFIYRDPGGKLKLLLIDLEKCTVQLLVDRDHLSALPQDLRIQIDEGTATRFNQSVRLAP